MEVETAKVDSIHSQDDKDDLDRIAEEYAAGELDELAEALCRVFRLRRDEILEFKRCQCEQLNRNINDDLALRLYLLEKQAVDLRLDVQAQLREIEKERWYQRERGCDKSDKEITMEWIQQHAEGWRCYRTTAYIYVYDQNQDYLLNCFSNWGGIA